MSTNPESVAKITARIAAAAERSGRRAEDVTLIAVTKTHSPATIFEAYQAGLRHFAENRVDELEEKIPALTTWLADRSQAEPAYWHYIGHIQSRQASNVLVARPYLIHSLDSLKLAQRINRLSLRDNLGSVNVLLQCNVSGEQSKTGFNVQDWAIDSDQLSEFLKTVEQVNRLETLTIMGLMTMAPYSAKAEASRPVFQSLAALRHRLVEEFPHVDWQHLSMGMTNDFEVAIEEGATMIRVGTALFGERVNN